MTLREQQSRGRESVWDYPTPPRIEPSSRHIRVEFAGVTLVDSRRALRVVETGNAPVYYVRRDDVRMEHLSPASHHTFCPHTGQAAYWTVRVGDRIALNGAWGYPEPRAGYEVLKDYVAFYAGKMDACYVGDERASPQGGGYYGGWLTADVEGPCKGEPGAEARKAR